MGQQISGSFGFKEQVNQEYQAEYGGEKEVIIIEQNCRNTVFKNCVAFSDLHCLQYKKNVIEVKEVKKKKNTETKKIDFLCLG